MIDFLKALIQRRGRSVTVVMLDEEQPDGPQSYQLQPGQLIPALGVGALGLVVLTWLSMVFTPLGALVYNRRDHQLRESIDNLSSKVLALNDSLDIRTKQLTDIKEVIIGQKDTTFQNVPVTESQKDYVQSVKDVPALPPISVDNDNSEVLNKGDLIYSDVLTRVPVFPTEMPVEGMITRKFEPQEGHYGIDIATNEGEEIHAVADGVVINTVWSINYGYVIYVQHGGGYVTIYKHCRDLGKQEGDVVLKGDVLATVGKTGLLTSGPHVHMELWHNGIALDPSQYLITK
ncbi:MAG TPA: M23 family metallopeptidase [Balneolales bacterium]|nr:M23 family metallopeptidase [Balneolales bacterium]